MSKQCVSSVASSLKNQAKDNGKTCQDCNFFRVDSDVDSCGSGASGVSVVSGLVLASCDAEMCPDEMWERESVEPGIGFWVRKQCSLKVSILSLTFL